MQCCRQKKRQRSIFVYSFQRITKHVYENEHNSFCRATSASAFGNVRITTPCDYWWEGEKLYTGKPIFRICKASSASLTETQIVVTTLHLRCILCGLGATLLHLFATNVSQRSYGSTAGLRSLFASSGTTGGVQLCEICHACWIAIVRLILRRRLFSCLWCLM